MTPDKIMLLRLANGDALLGGSEEFVQIELQEIGSILFHSIHLCMGASFIESRCQYVIYMYMP